MKVGPMWDYDTTAITECGANIATPENTEREPNAGVLLAQRRRRWASITPALDECPFLQGSTCLSPTAARSPQPSQMIF